MIPPMLSNKKYVFRICMIITILVIGIDFVFLNLGTRGLLNWKLHAITALYSFTITFVNLAYFDFINTKLNENTKPIRRILVGIIGATLLTLPTYFLCRLVHLVVISNTKTLQQFLTNERLELYLFPLLLTVVISLFFQSLFFLKAFQKNRENTMLFAKSESVFQNIPIPKPSNEFANKLQQLMTEEKCYQNSDLDLLKLSKNLGISKRKTSVLIQELYNKSFSDCINDFRLQEVLYRFKNQKHKKLTIIALAMEAGFPSKSTFYRYFKTRMGISPSEFLDQIESLKS